jgi:GGDEF domain-containing protein
VLLPCTDEPTARDIAERIRRAIAAQVSLLDGRVVRMTATVALSVRGPDEPADAASMRREAEHGLFGAVA